MDRRRFLKKSVSAAAGAAALAATASGRRSLARGSNRPRGGPNDLVGVGLIGCGGMGSAHLRKLVAMHKQNEMVRPVAVCDVWEKRLEAAVEASGAKPYKDYHKLLEDKDVDAVCIATPHHWHAQITIEAAEAQKDIYCEKPMTHWKNLKDTQRVVEAIARNDRVMQVGTNGMSDSIWDQARERVRAGALGELIHAQASDMRNGYIDVYDPTRSDPDAKPGENLDWDMWLGPAPRRDWYPGRFLSFRVYWDYAGGVSSDFFPHILTPLVYVMDLKFPKRAVSSGGIYAREHDDGRETPDIVTINIEYPGGPSILLLGGVANGDDLPMKIRGTKGTLTFEDPGAVVEPERATNKEGKREEIEREQGGSLEGHWRDFLQCVKTREKPRSNEVIGYHVMTALHMGIHSYREGRAMEFDEEKEEARFL